MPEPKYLRWIRKITREGLVLWSRRLLYSAKNGKFMLEVVVQILENMREVQGKQAIFGEKSE